MTAEQEFASAVAELKRAEGLWRGPLTPSKKALLQQRLFAARRALSRSAYALTATRPVADPLPRAS